MLGVFEGGRRGACMERGSQLILSHPVGRICARFSWNGKATRDGSVLNVHRTGRPELPDRLVKRVARSRGRLG